jgi:hypothetical protein
MVYENVLFHYVVMVEVDIIKGTGAGMLAENAFFVWKD